MKELITMLKLYSVQVLAILAVLNTLLSMYPNPPAWVVFALNACGLLAGYIARKVPQPVVTAELKAMKAIPG